MRAFHVSPNRSMYAVATLAIAAIAISSSVTLADWNNSGGNAARNGQADAVGPDAPDPLWSSGPSSIIAWQPVIEGDRVFMVRQTGFPQSEPGASTIYAFDLHTGDILWSQDIPFEGDDWTTWVAGVRNNIVYAARSGNGATVDDPLYALDAITGDILWESDDTINAGGYDGVVFAHNGDPVVADFDKIIRINATDGSTVWSTPRVCSVSSSCGAAISQAAHPGNAPIYVVEPEPGGHVVRRYDLTSGVFMYESGLMPGFTIQNTPMVGPDGAVYVSRTQNNKAVDFFYAWEDTGSELVLKWSVPAGWTTTSEFAVGPDNSGVYMIGDDFHIKRLDPDTGDVIDESTIVVDADFLSPRMAVDSLGRLFMSNGSFSDGRLYSFDADLTLRWDVAVTNINIGGPALASDGTLIIAGIGSDIRGYEAGKAPAACPADFDRDNVVGTSDLLQLLSTWGNCPGCAEDLDNDNVVGTADLLQLLSAWGPCP